MSKILTLTVMCIFMAFTAKNAFVLFVFLVYVPAIIGVEISKYRAEKKNYKDYLKRFEVRSK